MRRFETIGPPRLDAASVRKAALNPKSIPVSTAVNPA
jgi:hypothetical protein